MHRLCIGWIFGVLLFSPVFGQAPKPVDVLAHNTTSFHSANSASQIVRDEEGNVVTGWRSSRQGLSYSNVYVQKVSESGKTEWEMDGVPVCRYPANQDNFSLVSDGFGGVVAVWEDLRRGSDLPAVYAQRINLRGEALWGNDGLMLCNSKGAQRNPQVASDGANGFYVVWEDARVGINESDIYAQHLDLGGKYHWNKTGLPICTSPNIQQRITLATDEEHHLFLAWEDFRNGIYWNLFTQKLDREGTPIWGDGGLDIFSGVEENHQNPAIVSDGLGGLLFVYQKYSVETHGTDIYRGRLDARGELLFHFATCYSQDEQLNPQIVRKGSKAVLVWEDRRYGNWDIYGQMIRLRDGILEWGINGIPIVKTSADERKPKLIAALSYNYQIFAWLKRENGANRVYVQKCDNLGGRLWDPDGMPVCELSEEQREPAILADEGGGLWCSWTDRREKRYPNIYLQRINRHCEPTLRADGLRMGGKHEQVHGDVKGLQILAGRDGNFFVAWEDYRNGTENPDIYLQKVSPDGKSLWRRGGIPVCISPGEQSRPILVDDGVGGVIVAWADQRSFRDDDVYAQRISPWGKMLWRYNGVLVCGAPSSQSQISGVSDGQEGVLLAWVDARELAKTGFDLYIQRVNHSGEVLWKENGKPFVDLAGLQTSPVLESDGLGGAFISWMDYRGDFSNIYVQHINSFGLYEWEYGGRQIAPMATNQRHPVMARNFQDDLYLIWQEGRYGDGYEKLFMQCISPSGRKLWAPRGELVCNNPGRQAYPQIKADANGSFWATWLDERTMKLSGVRLFAQKFNMDGDPAWKADGVSLGESMEEYNDFDFVVCEDGAAYYCWTQKKEAGNAELHFQGVDPEGEKKWHYSLRSGTEKPVGQYSPAMDVNKDGKMLIIYGEGGRKTGIKAIPLEG